jgi:serine/arginine repetitive matrix protein 2
MTERTFRTPSPSPSRPAPRPEAIVHPPVPALPQNYANSPTAAPKTKRPKQRAASQDTSGPRLSSPPAARPASQAHGLDPFNSPPPQQQTPPTKRRPDLALTDELERTDSRNSINFSRPLSPRPQSPVPQSPVAHPSMLTNGDRFPPNVVASIPPAHADDIQYGLTQVANQPVKKKKKKVAAHSTEGSHLHDGTMASRPVVTPLEPGPEHTEPPFPQDQQQAAPKKKKKKKAEVTSESSHFPSAEYTSRADSDSDSNPDKTREKRSQRASGVLQKQPSIVKEDWEGEQNEQGAPIQGQNGVAPEQFSAHLAASSSPTTTRPLTEANVSRKIGEPSPAPKPLIPPTTADYHALTTVEQSDSSPASSTSLQVQAPQAVRGSSLSPSRSTRFSDRLSSDLAAGRKHDPLPRSVSPAKSALKQHSPAPSGSPLDPSFNKPRGASATPSETSDISTAEADALPKRKKSARVSFDAGPEIVAQATSGEPIESPSKEKKGWLGLGKSKPTLSTIPSNDDMEELMKPRPQLPSFGSVRGQKSRDGNDTSTSLRLMSQENRAQYSNDGKPMTSSVASSETSSSSFNNTTPTGVSSDHLVGAIFAQEAQRYSQPKFARNEPLPPEVTSVEGGVSFSDSESATSEEEEEDEVVAPPVPAAEEIVVQEAQAPTPNPVSLPAPATSSPIELPSRAEVPFLSVSPPTPALEQTKPSDQWQVEVPGGFPVSTDALAQLNESKQGRYGHR